uniref:Uncharacterized protein n=1 Tax=Arundo donax TaxID=35708 RepID=A0A0A9E113_ARUDO
MHSLLHGRGSLTFMGVGFEQLSKVGEEQGEAGGDDKNQQCERG